MSATVDRIERDVLIAAPLERVWAVVSEPQHIGRWFSEAAESSDGVVREGSTLTMSWKEHGTYTVVVQRYEPPHVFAYRGAYEPGDDPTPENSTLVEFFLSTEGSGTRLRVVESGFAGMAVSDELRQTRYDGNVDGWRQQIDNVRQYAEQP